MATWARMIRALQTLAVPGSRERLEWAVRVRWLVIGGFFALALVAWQVRLLPTLRSCVLAAGLGTVLNGLNHWCVARWRHVRAVTALAVPGDVLLITYVMINTGGVQSPFTMMYVVQVVATAMLVDLVVAGASAVASVGCFVGTLLLQRAGFFAAGGEVMAGGDHGAPYQLVWALFLLYCLGLLTYLAGYISERLRCSEEDLVAKNRNLCQTIGALERAHADLQATCVRLQDTEAQLVQSEKMRALGQFVAGIAHELNNPITFVAANIEHLQRFVGPVERMLTAYGNAALGEPGRTELAEQRRVLRIDEFLDDLPGLLEDCEEGARRAAEIVAALRSFSRGDRLGEWGWVDVHDRLDRTLALLRHRLGDGVTVERAYAALPPVECMPGQLDQVFLNLLSNAVDAVGARGRIGICTSLQVDPPHARRRGGHAVVSVSDNGVGIPEDLRTRVFDPFFTTKEEGKGTGLGLSVSYGIAERHGGTITMESVPGRGSTFTLYIPVTRQP